MEELEKVAKTYAGCEEVGKCEHCEWMPDEDEKRACSNRIEHDAFIAGARWMVEKNGKKEERNDTRRKKA